jgi:hypothetical protein
MDAIGSLPPSLADPLVFTPSDRMAEMGHSGALLNDAFSHRDLGRRRAGLKQLDRYRMLVLCGSGEFLGA